MGFFSRKTKQDKELKKENSVMFMGASMQPIGKITKNQPLSLRLDSELEKLVIYSDGEKILLPYERMVAISIEDESTIKSGTGLGGAVLGGFLFGGVGALVGQQATKGKSETNWYCILQYKDKNGDLQELSFIQHGLIGPLSQKQKPYNSEQFEKAVNLIIKRYSESITEL